MITKISFIGKFEEIYTFAKDIFKYINTTQNDFKSIDSFNLEIAESNLKVQAKIFDFKQINFLKDEIKNSEIIILFIHFKDSESFNFLNKKWTSSLKNVISDNKKRFLIGQTADDFDSNKFSQNIFDTLSALNLDKYFEKKNDNYLTEKQKIGSLTIFPNFPDYLIDQIRPIFNLSEGIQSNDEILLEEGPLNLILFKKSYTAKVIQSPNATGNVLIKTFYTYENDRYLVTTVDDRAFRNTKIESVSFEEDSHVKKIGNFAFQNSTILRLSIPNKLVEFGEDWCKEVESLTEITINANHEHFQYENGLLINKDYNEIIFARRDLSGGLTLPNNIKRIRSSSFYTCKKILSFNIESSALESIDSFAFCQCELLKNLTISGPKQLILGDNCFSFNKSLLNVILSCEELIVERNCFQFCSSIVSLNFSNVKKISFGQVSLLGCDSLADIYIPYSSSIEFKNQCFLSLKNLKSLFFNSDKFTICNDSFKNCSLIHKVYLKTKDDFNSNFVSDFHLLKNVDLTSLSTLIVTNSSLSNATELEEIRFRSKNLILEEGCFKNHEKLLSIDIECENAITFQSDSFEGCKKLKSFKFVKSQYLTNPSEKIELPEKFFCNFKALEEVEIEARKINIGNNCFNGCSSLKLFKIKESRQTLIGSKQFIDCSNLKKISIAVSKDSQISSLLNKENLILARDSFEGANKLDSIEFIGGNININKDLMNYSCLSCISIQSANNAAIDSDLFNNCKELTSISINSKSLRINKNCFNNNGKLQSVAFSVSDIDIHSNCFNSNKQLNSIQFKKVDFINLDSNDFCNCKNILNIDFSCSSYIVIGQNCFNKLDKLQKIKLFSKEITIGFKSFLDCSSLISVQLSDVAEEPDFYANLARTIVPRSKMIEKTFVGDEAFCSCARLTELNIRTNKEIFIGKKCFYNLKNLRTIKINSGEIIINENSFFNCPGKKEIPEESFSNPDKGINMNSLNIQDMFERKKSLTSKPIKLCFENDKRFDSFYVLGIDRYRHTPSFISMFPARPITLPISIIQSIPLFCYPQELKPIPANFQTESNILTGFVFYIADQTYIGVALHIYIPPSFDSFVGNQYDRSYPFCLCLITNNPDIASHFSFLSDLVHPIVGKTSLPLINIEVPPELQNQRGNCYPSLFTRPNCEYIALSSSGRSLQFLLPKLVNYYKDINFQSLEQSDCLLYPTLQTLLTYLSPRSIVEVVLSMLCEYRIILISKDINGMNRISFCILALTNLMKDLDIHMKIIPFLPSNLHDLVYSPFPSIIGYHKSCNDIDILVDLDKNTVNYTEKSVKSIIQHFPYSSTLIKKVENLLSKNLSKITISQNPKCIQNANKNIYPECFQYFAQTKYILSPELVRDFSALFTKPFVPSLKSFTKNFFITDSTNPDEPVTIFNKSMFSYHIQEKYKDFMQVFINTITFDQFQLKLEKEIENSRNPREIRIKSSQDKFNQNKTQISLVLKKSSRPRRMSYSAGNKK